MIKVALVTGLRSMRHWSSKTILTKLKELWKTNLTEEYKWILSVNIHP